MSDAVTGRGKNEVSVVHRGTKYTIDIDAELAIDEQNIKDCYIDQAGKFAWYAVVHAAAMKRVDDLKTELDVVGAEVGVAKAAASARLKEEMTERTKDAKGNEKVKLPAQNAIEAILDSQPEVKSAREKVAAVNKSLVQARYEQEVVKAVKDAFTHRRDMLIQLGADARMEQRDRA